MKSIRAMLVAAAVTLGATSAAQAAGVGLRAGTTGIGGDVGFSLMPTLSARIGYSGLSYNTDIDDTDIEYDADMKLSNLNLLLDFSPLPGPFRITGGIIFNDNKADLVARPSGGTYTINGRSYSAATVGSLAGTVKTGNSAAPYVGIGYGNVAGFGVNFYFDLGVMYQGSPKVSLAASCGAGVPANLCAQLQSDVQAEQSRLSSDLTNFKWYPVANIGVTIGF